MKSSIKAECGIVPEKLIELKNLSEHFVGHQKYVSLIFDEMKINKGLVQYNEIIGFVDLGDNDLILKSNLPQNVLATHIFALFVKGISTNIIYMDALTTQCTYCVMFNIVLCQKEIYQINQISQ